MIMPLLDLEETRAELADTREQLDRLLNRPVMDEDARRIAVESKHWWIGRLERQVAELEAAS